MAGRACSSRPPRRTAATRAASPVPSSVSTAIAHSVAGPVAGSNFGGRNLAQEARQRLVLRHADDRVVVAGHADVGDEGGAAGQNLMVGGGRMSMGADDEARAAVDEMAHRLLLARRLGMDVDHDRVGRALERAGGKLALDRRERIVERVHEHAPHGVDDEDARAVARLDDCGAAARRAGRIIDRPDQERRALDEYQRLPLVPGVVAERDRVGAGVHQFAIDRLGDAEPPPAAFSPLTTTRSSFQSATRPGSRDVTAERPLRPTTSPMNKMRIKKKINNFKKKKF